MKTNLKIIRKIVQDVIKESMDENNDLESVKKELGELQRQWRRAKMVKNPSSGPGMIAGDQVQDDMFLGTTSPWVPNEEMKELEDKIRILKDEYKELIRARKPTFTSDPTGETELRVMYGGDPSKHPRGLGS